MPMLEDGFIEEREFIVKKSTIYIMLAFAPVAAFFLGLIGSLIYIAVEDFDAAAPLLIAFILTLFAIVWLIFWSDKSDQARWKENNGGKR